MLKKNTLTEEQLDIVRGGLAVPYFDKTQEFNLDASDTEPKNKSTKSQYVQNSTKEQKFIL